MAADPMTPASGAHAGTANDGTVELTDDPSIGELFTRLTTETADLVKAEIRLAKAEITQEVKKAGKGAGMLGGAGFAGYMALLLLSFAAAWGLAEVLPAGVAFLIVGLVYAALAGTLALLGRKELASVDPVPEKTIESLKEDAEWLRK